MSFQEALYAKLSTITEANHVFPLRIPDDDPTNSVTYPVLVYEQVSGPREYTHSGTSGPHRARWQITAWGKTYDTTRALAEATVTAISAWDESGEGAKVTRSVCFIANEIDLYDADSRLFYVPIDAEVLIEP